MDRLSDSNKYTMSQKRVALFLGITLENVDRF